MISAIWPELLVAVLFLAGDLIWDGTAAGIAGAAAGVISFLIETYPCKNTGLSGPNGKPNKYQPIRMIVQTMPIQKVRM